VKVCNIFRIKNRLIKYGDFCANEKIATYTPTSFFDKMDINNIVYIPLSLHSSNNIYYNKFRNYIIELYKLYDNNIIDYVDKCINNDVDFIKFGLPKEIDINEDKYNKYLMMKFYVYNLIGIDDYELYNNIDKNAIGELFMKKNNNLKGEFISSDLNSPEIRLFIYLTSGKSIDIDIYEYLIDLFGACKNRNEFKYSAIKLFYNDINDNNIDEFIRENKCEKIKEVYKFCNTIKDFRKHLISSINTSEEGDYIEDKHGRRIFIERDNIDNQKFERKIFASFLQSSITNYNFNIAYSLVKSGLRPVYISREEILLYKDNDFNLADINRYTPNLEFNIGQRVSIINI